MKTIHFLFAFLLIAKVNSDGLLSRLIGGLWPSKQPKNAAIFFNSQGENICSGALIHPLWVLTTASCALKIYDEERRVLFGGNVELDFNKANHIEDIEVYNQININSGGKANSTAPVYDHDIALVKLLQAAPLNSRILKVSRSWNVPSGTKAFALGYGDFGFETNNGTLRQRRVSILDNLICEKYPVDTNFNKMCTYQSIACTGDEGGPLISESSNELIGLISITGDQASMCGGDNIIPITTYIKVAFYSCWITDIIKIGPPCHIDALL